MFGERLSKKTEAGIEKNTGEFSIIHRAGLMLFAGLLHVGAYHEYLSAPKQIAEIKMVIKAAESEAETRRWLAEDARLKKLQAGRQHERSDWLSLVQKDIYTELESGKGHTIPISSVLGYEAYFVEGVPIETIEKGLVHFQEVAQRLVEMRAKEDPTLVYDDVLNAVLAEQGEYDENQSSGLVLFATGRGNCLARAEADAMLLDYVVPENRGTDWLQTELYRGYTDATGKKHLGHIRLVLNFEGSDTLTVMEGHEAYDVPRVDDHVTRLEAHEAFVRGSAIAMGINTMEQRVSDGYEPQRLGIVFPDSPVRYLGSEDGSTQWWAGKAPEPPKEGEQYRGIASDVNVLDEAITDEDVKKLVEQKKEKTEPSHRFEAFLEAHKNEGVEMTESTVVANRGIVGSAKSIILPLNVPPETRRQTEAFVAELRKATPDATFKLLYGITANDQKITPLADPNAEYIFLIPPTPKLMEGYSLLPSKDRVIVKNVQMAIREKGIIPGEAMLSICDPVTSLADLQGLNAFIEEGHAPHIVFGLDLPEEIMDIPLHGYSSVHLKHADALEGKTLSLTEGHISVAYIQGSMPSLRGKNINIDFWPMSAEQGQRSLILGAGTEISGNWINMRFNGPVIIQEGWKAHEYSPVPEDEKYATALDFYHEVSFGARAFAGIQTPVDIYEKYPSYGDIDPQMFDGLSLGVKMWALSIDGKKFLDIDSLEKRMHSEVQIPSSVTMSAEKGKYMHEDFLHFTPGSSSDQK